MRLMHLPVAFLIVAAAPAQDAQLAALHATLTTLHSHAPEPNYETLGATPELAVVKHQLRDWIESRLGALKDLEHLEATSNEINGALKGVSVTDSKDDQNLLGSLGDVRFSSESGLLIITTAVGILCQYDESAYAYKSVNGQRQRIWESEQNDYSPKKYTPQHIVAVHAWQSWKDVHVDGPPFVMTLGNSWGCASTWHPVHYRAWRIDPSGPRLLIDDSEDAWMRAETYIVGSIGRDWRQNSPVDVLIEFTERSIDGGVHNREAVRHFLIEGDQVRRVDPVALSPRDFVDEWLTRSWDESVTWSASPSLQQWHRKLHADFVAGDFDCPTMHCQTPGLWQVTVAPSNAQKNSESEPDVYFLVRWSPPYHFKMVEISDKGWPRCNQKDPEADAWRTLFNTQEWR
jgi:hypothetical protein